MRFYPAFINDYQSDYKNEADAELENDSNRYLHGHFGKDNGIYTEFELNRKCNRDTKFSTFPSEEAIEEALGDEGDICEVIHGVEPTLGELIDAANLNPQEMKATRLLMKVRRQRLVAAEMKISQPMVSRIISAARVKVVDAGKRLREREPSDWALKLWHDELAMKRRQNYKKRRTPWGRIKGKQRKAA